MSQAFTAEEPATATKPIRLAPDASPSEQIAAINGLAVEIQLVRYALQELGTGIGEVRTLLTRLIATK